MPMQRIRRRSKNSLGGFSLYELLVVVAIIFIISAIALPSYTRISQTYRVRNDVNSLMGLINVARMRAASDFARARIQCDATKRTCTLSVKQFKADNTQSWPSSPNETQTVVLSQNIIFGIPSGASSGAGGQATPVQGNTGQTGPYNLIFNSRGLPIKDDATGTIVGDYALYLKDSKYNYAAAVAVDVSGRPQVYIYRGTSFKKAEKPGS